MPDSQHAADAFIRFMECVTGTLPHQAPTPDPDEVRISELEQQIRLLRRSLRQRARRRRSGPPGEQKSEG